MTKASVATSHVLDFESLIKKLVLARQGKIVKPEAKKAKRVSLAPSPHRHFLVDLCEGKANPPDDHQYQGQDAQEKQYVCVAQ